MGPLGPGLPLRWEEKSRRYFRFLRAWWRLKRVEGLRTMAERIRRAGRMRRAHKPATRRSEVRRFGDRCRERLRIRSCCLTRTDSATTERKPPGPRSNSSRIGGLRAEWVSPPSRESWRKRKDRIYRRERCAPANSRASLCPFLLRSARQSDTPRKAGGLMSRTASKAVGSLVEASRRARLGFRA